MFNSELIAIYQSTALRSLSQSWMLYPIPLGALTQLYAGTMPDAVELNGKVSLLFRVATKSKGNPVYDPVGSYR